MVIKGTVVPSGKLSRIVKAGVVEVSVVKPIECPRFPICELRVCESSTFFLAGTGALLYILFAICELVAELFFFGGDKCSALLFAIFE